MHNGFLLFCSQTFKGRFDNLVLALQLIKEGLPYFELRCQCINTQLLGRDGRFLHPLVDSLEARNIFILLHDELSELHKYFAIEFLCCEFR